MNGKAEEVIAETLVGAGARVITYTPTFGGNGIFTEPRRIGGKPLTVSCNEETAYAIAHGAALAGVRAETAGGQLIPDGTREGSSTDTPVTFAGSGTPKTWKRRNRSSVKPLPQQNSASSSPTIAPRVRVCHGMAVALRRSDWGFKPESIGLFKRGGLTSCRN
jgi:hypothetical protein